MANPMFQSPEFLGLPDEEKLVQARAKSSAFSTYYDQDPEGALAMLRESAGGSDTSGRSAVGNVIRGVAYGLGEAGLDAVALPFDAAEWVASKAGSDWSTTIDDSIEEYKRETFPESTTPEGRIARSTGYWAGIGLSTFATGGAFSWVGAFPKLGALGKVGRVLSGGAKMELVAGASAGLAEGLVEESMDDLDPMKPWAKIGAGILAGLGGAGGVAIAARGASRRAKLQAAGGQPTSRKKDGSPSSDSVTPDVAALDAADDARTNELRQIWQQEVEADEVGHLAGGLRGDDLVRASDDSIERMKKFWVNEAYQGMPLARFKEVVKGVGKVMERSGVPLDPQRTLISQIQDEIRSGRITLDEADDILKNFDSSVLSIFQLTDPAGSTASDAARVLQLLSVESKRRKRALFAAMTPEQQALAKQVGGPNVEGLGFWKRLENTRRGLLVTQLATAMRNLETQVANVSIHTLEDMFEDVVHKMFYSKEVQMLHPDHGIETILRLGQMLKPRNVRKTKSKTYNEFAKLEDYFAQSVDPKDRALFQPLLGNFSADILINPASDKLGALEKMTLWLNSANRLQEFSIRKAVFTANLDRSLSMKGDDLARVISEGRVGDLDRGDIKNAIGEALEATWGEQFHSHMKGGAGFAGKAIDLVNHAGVGPFQLTQVIPFPRFMANSIKWQWNHSPLPALKMLVSPKGWQAIARGDIRPLVQSTSGTAMFMAAYQMRDSEMASEKWHDINIPEGVASALGMDPGSTLDIRPFNPFASMVFVADLLVRAKNGTLENLDTRQVAMGLASVNLRAGAGMYVLDKFFDGMAKAASGLNNPEESFAEALKEGAAGYMGAAWSGMFVPFQQLRDVAASFDESLGTDNRTVRDTRDSPFMGQLLRKLPYGDEHLPPVELPTRADAPKSEAGIYRQLTGATLRGPKNPVEKELDRMGFSRGEILPGTGNTKWDRMRAKHMGPIVERQIAPLVQSREYLRQDDEEKSLMLKEFIARARRAATARAGNEDPELASKMKFNSKSKRYKRWYNKRSRQARERSERMESMRVEKAGF